MTLNEMVAEARQKSRVHNIDQDDATVAGYLNEAILRFSEEVGGRVRDGYVSLDPLFDISATHGITVKTDSAEHDLVLTADDLDDATGAQVAASLQVQLRDAFSDATITVVWSTSTWQFTITIPGATEISIEKPPVDYFDGTRFLGGEDSSAGEEYSTSGYLGYVTEGTLPDEFIAPLTIRWNGRQLAAGNFESMKGRGSGQPGLYAVRDKRLRVGPMPAAPGYVEMLSMQSFPLMDVAQGDEEPDFPREYRKALPYYAASMMSENRFEYEIADRMLGQFMKYAAWYRLNYGNDDTKIGFKGEGSRSRLRNEEVEI